MKENPTFNRICELVRNREVRGAVHAYQRAAKRGILISDIVNGFAGGVVIEDYPDYHLGPAILVLQSEPDGTVVHAVWGIEKGTTRPAVLVTAYRPDPSDWSDDFRRRKS